MLRINLGTKVRCQISLLTFVVGLPISVAAIVTWCGAMAYHPEDHTIIGLPYTPNDPSTIQPSAFVYYSHQNHRFFRGHSRVCFVLFTHPGASDETIAQARGLVEARWRSWRRHGITVFETQETGLRGYQAVPTLEQVRAFERALTETSSITEFLRGLDGYRKWKTVIEIELEDQ